MRFWISKLLAIVFLGGALATAADSPTASEFTVIRAEPFETTMKLAHRHYGSIDAWKRVAQLNGNLEVSTKGMTADDFVLVDKNPATGQWRTGKPEKPVFEASVCTADLARCCKNSPWAEKGLACLRADSGKCVSMPCKIFATDACAADYQKFCPNLEGDEFRGCVKKTYVTKFSEACIHQINPCRGVGPKLCPNLKDQARVDCMLAKRASLPPLCARELDGLRGKK